MADPFYGYDDTDSEPKGRDNLFLWTVFILLLIGAAAACWMGSFYIFGHPELPRSYALLKKLKKIDAPLRFEVTAAPPGEFLNPQKLFERYSKFTRLELENENGELIRNYLRNYRDTKKLVTYVTGRYAILDSYDLKRSDMFPTGVVALAQAAEFPQVVLEHVYTAAPRDVPALRALLQTGVELKLQRTEDLSAVIHAERIPDGHIQITVVPLLYGSYALKQGSGTFSLEPPQELNMAPGLPVIKAQGFNEGLSRFAAFRRDHPLPNVAPNAPEATPAPKPELVRVDTVEPGKPVPETGAMPAVPVATPGLIAGQPTPRFATAPPMPAAKVTPMRAATPSRLAMLTAPTPYPSPKEAGSIPTAPAVPFPSSTSSTSPPLAAITPLPGSAGPLPKVSPDGVPLQPFIAAQRDPNMASNGASWRTYQPGQVPPGHAVTLEEVPSLANRDNGERLYLRGDFRVTASGVSRAVLRDAARTDDQSPRVVVEYPPGDVPPQERETFTRDAARPFLVTDIRRGADGVVTIYVREIINQ